MTISNLLLAVIFALFSGVHLMAQPVVTWKSGEAIPPAAKSATKIKICHATDQDIGQMVQLNNQIEELYLDEAGYTCGVITSKGIASIAQLTRLRTLHLLGQTRLNPVELRELGKLKSLEDLAYSQRPGGRWISQEEGNAPPIGTFTSLKRLRLEGLRKLGQSFFASLGANTSLTSVVLVNCETLTDDILRYLGDAEQLQELKLLECNSFNIEAETMELFCRCQRLQTLRIDSVTAGDQTFRSIARFASLKELGMRVGGLSDEALGVLAEMPQLERISLFPLDTLSYRTARLISRISGLRTIDLSGVVAREGSLAAMADSSIRDMSFALSTIQTEAIEQSAGLLLIKSLSCMSLKIKGDNQLVVACLNKLRSAKCLTHLTLEQVYFTAEIARLIAAHTELTSLDCRGARFEAGAFQELCQISALIALTVYTPDEVDAAELSSLSRLKQLEHVVIEMPTCVNLVLDALASCAKLRSISLASMKPVFKAVPPDAKWLYLETLALSALGKIPGAKLYELVACAPNLAELHMYLTELDEQELPKFVDLLAQHQSSLRMLDLRDSFVSESVLLKITELKKLRTVYISKGRESVKDERGVILKSNCFVDGLARKK